MEKPRKNDFAGIFNTGFLTVVVLSIALVVGCSNSDDTSADDTSADSGTSTAGDTTADSGTSTAGDTTADSGTSTAGDTTADSGTSTADDTIADSGTSADSASSSDDDASTDEETTVADLRPVVFVHGGSGSASQFESQSQRFMSNGYPLNYLAAYEHPTGSGAPDPANQIDGLDEIIDAALDETGADQVDLMGHSRGGGVCFYYLESSPERAAKVAHYVAIDSGTGLNLTTGMQRTPGNVEMLALWGEGDQTREVVGATNVYIPTQAHVEMATAAASFVEMYKFFNGEEPQTDQIVEADGDQVEIAGRVNYYPTNDGGNGTLRIYEVDSNTGFRISDEPVAELILNDGEWGPQTIDKGATYEFALEAESGEKHSIYREPFFANDYFIRLITVPPGGTIESLMTRTSDHADIVIMRDREIWGDQGDNNDILTVDGTNVATETAAANSNRTIVLFLMDWGPNAHPDLDTSGTDFSGYALGESNLEEPIALFHAMGFISALDLFIPAASPPDRTIEVKLVPRGGEGAEQVINVPNWASTDLRMSVVFRDFVQ